MDGVETQLSKGIDYSKSNIDLIQKSLIQARTGVEELVSSYNGKFLWSFLFSKTFANSIVLQMRASKGSTTGSRHLPGNSKTNNWTHSISKAGKID